MNAFLPIFLLAAFFALPAAASIDCEPYPDVPVNINPVFDEPAFDGSQNLAAIQAIASDHAHSIPQYHAVTLGITRYEPILQFNAPLEILSQPGELSCARVKQVDVTVGYHNVTVFVARDIPPGSCGYRETLEHEGKHVAVNRALLNEYAPLIEARLKSYLKINGEFRVPDADYAKKLLTEKLRTVMSEIIGQMQAENIRRQQAVDSPQEYERLSDVCGGQLSRVAERFRETGR